MSNRWQSYGSTRGDNRGRYYDDQGSSRRNRRRVYDDDSRRRRNGGNRGHYGGVPRGSQEAFFFDRSGRGRRDERGSYDPRTRFDERKRQRDSIKFNPLWTRSDSDVDSDDESVNNIEVAESASSSSSSSSGTDDSSSSDSSSSESSASTSAEESRRRRRHRRSNTDVEAAPRKRQKATVPSPPLDQPDPQKFVQDQCENSSTSSEEEDIGPRPSIHDSAAAAIMSRRVSYGDDLMPGEGSAIAQFVKNDMRIPRRGEVGYSGDQIEKFEHLGYVMSGSRHKIINAVRQRKEAQVYSAEEARALALYNHEEKQKKEAALLGEFREMLARKAEEKN